MSRADRNPWLAKMHETIPIHIFEVRKLYPFIYTISQTPFIY
jgi:hypothetical protein